MACPYTFAAMWANYPRPSDLSRDDLFRYLGWGNDQAIMDPAGAYQNTCAIRMSVCLIRCGMNLDVPPIGARVQASCPDTRLRNRAVVLTFDRLARTLKMRWGDPTVVKKVREADLNNRQGVIAFFKLQPDAPGGGYPGHIDLIRDTAAPWTFLLFSGDDTNYQAGSHAYFGSGESWFWPSKG